MWFRDWSLAAELRRAPFVERSQAFTEVVARPRTGERRVVVVARCRALERGETDLVALDGAGRERGDVVRPRERVVERAAPLREAEAHRGIAVDHVRREQDRARRSVTGQRRRPLHGPQVDHETELGGGDPEAGAWRRDAQVAGDGE